MNNEPTNKISGVCKVDQWADESAAFLKSKWDALPRFGIVLGTGSGELAEKIDAKLRISYGDIPNFPRSTAMGHAGQLVCGTLAGQPVIAMQGCFHLYEGWSVDRATLAIHVMHRMGINTLFVSNAAGGLNPKMASGDIMLINSHIDFMYRSTPNMCKPAVSERPSHKSDVYDRGLIDQAKSLARNEGFAIHEGAYAALIGPNYETRAEYRFLKRIGADVAGMSTVPEVAVASRYDMRVLGMSIITNVAKPDVLDATSGQEVIDAAKTAAPNFRKVVVNAIENNL